MATVAEILGKCSMEELRLAAHESKVSDKGPEAELVSRLASGVPPKKILESISNRQLQRILESYQLPRSGNKSELVTRVVSLLKPAKREVAEQAREPVRQPPAVGEKETAYSKGHRFEDEIAGWAKKAFKELSLTE